MANFTYILPRLKTMIEAEEVVGSVASRCSPMGLSDGFDFYVLNKKGNQ